MLKNVISLYIFFAVLMTTFFTAYVLSKGRYSYLKVFSALTFCVSLYLFGYLLEINNINLEQMIFWNQIQYLGLPFLPALWLMMALMYTKKIHIKGWTLVLLFSIPILTFIFRFTNSFHHFFYRSMELQQVSGFTLLYLEKGPWYFVQNFYILLSVIITNIVFYREYRKSSKSSRPDQSRFQVLLVASLLPYIGINLILFNFMGWGIDYTALLMPISIFLIMFAMVKYDFLEIKTLAHETIFKKSPDGMILLDNEYRITDYNKSAQDFFSALNISLQNYPIEDILGHQHELMDIFKSESSRDFQFMPDGQERFFEINSVVIRNTYERNVGMLKTIRDITERKKGEEELKLSEEKYRMLTENISDVIWVLDLNTKKFRYVSPSVESMYGYTIQELMMLELHEIIAPDSLMYMQEMIPKRREEYYKGNDVYYNDEIKQICKDGHVIMTEVTGRFILNSLTGSLEWMGVSRDITEKKKLQEKLKILATIDALSGLNNREQFMELARNEFERAKRYKRVFSLLMMDIDHFKSINDTKGHAAGDAVIREMGRLINTGFRKTDISGRLGGEEFAVVMINTSIDEARLAAENFRETVANTKVVYDHKDISLSISIGVTSFFSEAKNIYQILKYADEALYQSKALGRNCTTLKLHQ